MQGCSEACACSDALPSKSLYAAIDMDKVAAQNERLRGSCLEVLKKAHSDRHGPPSAHGKDAQGLLVKIPFVHKVSLNKIEIKSGFTQMEVVANNQYVTLSSKPKNSDKYTLTGTEHILPVPLPNYKYKNVDCLTVRLTGGDERSLSYLSLCGAVTGALPTAVNVSYELYPLPGETKAPKASQSPLLH
ncbi:hypothetical protein NEDG_02105 [Nematocida displodere]|uniref:PITH domain-containing protein n=1 Tax=Nematocida displodere TaxID=1805483 RepID=A0A177EKF9_9MICR|nr:hypothetical protein NEDG_02105 [Nematocida displodere]